MNTLTRQSKKVLIAIVGGMIVLVGLVLIPYPGPGWLVVFSGLAVLGTEFAFASKLLTYGKEKYEAWVVWIKRQPIVLQLVVLSFTGLVVLMTIWLVNGFGMAGVFLGLEVPWLTSPLFR